jgi:hypothetical protein
MGGHNKAVYIRPLNHRSESMDGIKECGIPSKCRRDGRAVSTGETERARASKECRFVSFVHKRRL